MKIKWIGHACFQIVTDDNKVIYTDPYQISSGEPADIILTSHSHYDHQDKKSIKAVITENTVVICPKSDADKLKKYNPTTLNPGDSAEIAGIKITAVPAYNPVKAFHPKGNKWVGFVIEAGGKKIYHAGDTGPIPEMKELTGIDVAMIPAGGQYTMGFEDVVEVAKMIKPTILVPMHSWDKDLTPLKDMVSGAVPSVTVEILEGKELEI